MAFEIELFDEFERASQLFLKGFSYKDIARELDITTAAAKNYVQEYQRFIRTRAEGDSDALDRVVENTFQVLDEVSMLSKEAWLLFEQAKNNEMPSTQLQALKLAGEFTDKRAKLLQLMGAKADSGNVAKLQRLEKVNEIVSNVLKEVIIDCPRCRFEAQTKLAEAFSLMDKTSDITDAELVEDE